MLAALTYRMTYERKLIVISFLAAGQPLEC
ncbi:UNVERIFIED_ORG: hypothetical protein J2Y78_003336 [Buttiauxella agrestis ATCC 33320]